ncbi:TPR repeat-containing protein [Chryseolinea serpens]|uniref:TPR repeat-containing protein n=1 Tax=Chryseolinea serpens TaxID=947013 RepID=A0A1M5L8X0_9BACT|nr:histidine kinase [Chryseolinea serpens]SHG61564.1 TPR repeat-containing protein [Chryseolinea serpens]
MRHRIVIAFCFLGILLWTTGYGQASKKDSYSKFKSNSSRQSVTVLLNEASGLKDKDPQGALSKVQEALGLSLANGESFNEGRCYLLLGEINEGLQEWKLALDNYGHAREKFLNPKGGYSDEYVRAVQGMGNTALKLGQYSEALQYFEEALQLSKNANQKATLQLSLSEVYYQMERYQEALDALKEIDLSPKKIASSNSFSNQANNQEAKIYARLNDLDKSKALFDNSVNTLRQTKDVSPEEDQSLQKTKEEIAGVFRSQNRYDDEIDLRNKSIEYNLESNNFSEVTKDKVEIGKTLDAKGEPRAALRAIEEATRMADTLHNPKEQMYAYQTLANLYEKNGMTSKALDAYHKFSFHVNQADSLNELQRLQQARILNIQKDITELSKNVSLGKQEESLELATVARQRIIIYGLLALLLVIGTTSYFTYKNAQASKVANQLLALKSLRSQMNPHFIFNALNSVNHFIAQQDERAANKFLSEFSQLMRLVLENSQEDFIPLQQEQDILSLYLKLEHYRFRDKFDYTIDVDASLNTEAMEVPPMLIQPYIENAVWHGLRYREEKGHLSLRFIKDNGQLVVEIKDNGIGRKRSAALKTAQQKKHRSTGLKNIRERLDILNKVYKTHYRVAIDDLPEGSGTEVRVYLPMKNHTGSL